MGFAAPFDAPPERIPKKTFRSAVNPGLIFKEEQDFLPLKELETWEMIDFIGTFTLIHRCLVTGGLVTFQYFARFYHGF